MEDGKLTGKLTGTGLLNSRPTIGLLIANVARPWELPQWQGVVDAARERGANLICVRGGELRTPSIFEAQANVLYDLVSGQQLHGLVLWTAGFDNYVSPAEVAEFCARY